MTTTCSFPLEVGENCELLEQSSGAALWMTSSLLVASEESSRTVRTPPSHDSASSPFDASSTFFIALVCAAERPATPIGRRSPPGGFPDRTGVSRKLWPRDRDTLVRDVGPTRPLAWVSMIVSASASPAPAPSAQSGERARARRECRWTLRPDRPSRPRLTAASTRHLAYSRRLLGNRHR